MTTYYVLFALIPVILYLAKNFSDEISLSRLEGKWHSEQQHPSGATMSADIEINPDRTFSGMFFVNGQMIWQYEGTVELNGHRLTWHYSHESKTPPPSVSSTDTILSIESGSYTCKAGLDDEISLYQRVA